MPTLSPGGLNRRGYLGLEVEATQDPRRTSKERERWAVSVVTPDSPASRAGLRVGDDIETTDGAPVETLAALRSWAASVPPGTSCELGVWRSGRLLPLRLVSTSMPLETLTSGRVELDSLAWQHANLTHRLRAIWTLPKGSPRAALWLLPSATWMSQECPLDPEDPTFQLIDHLTSRGIATLRVDRSGLGDSQGPPAWELDFHAELSMWLAARSYFLSRAPGPRRLLYGRSLGGILAPLLAAEAPFDAVAAWGTTPYRWHEGSLRSAAHQRRLAGMTGEPLARAMAQVERLQSLVYLSGLTPAQARARHPELDQVLPFAFAGDRAHDRNVAFFQQLQLIDIKDHWRRVSAEVLAVHAAYDIIVPASDLAEIPALTQGPARFVSLPGVDHFLHERDDLASAVAVPWGGRFSLAAARLLESFFLGGLAALDP